MSKKNTNTKCPRCGSGHITLNYTTEPKQAKCKDCRKVWAYSGQTFFEGEMMNCALCGKEQQSDSKVESNWRILKLDERTYYVCTDHFPLDDAPKEAFTEAYYNIISHLATRQD